MRKRIMESFREQKDLFMRSENEKHNGNTVGFEGYLKNNLDDKNTDITNLNMFLIEKDPKVTLSRSSTSEVTNPGYQKKVSEKNL